MKNNEGFIAFTSLLIISAIALAVSISIATLGVSSARSSLDYKKGKETYAIAKSCSEIALLKLRDNATYSGEGLNVGNGSCVITVSGSGTDRTIDITATITNPPPSFTKSLRLTAKRVGNSINITTFSEI